uniref:UBP1-associated protein 2C-like isoform X2 n=1 Tax=Erigeron canadensis TaxID=72917 RepID=UPI001CB98A50|nr:UBP1-associated protein 2C-like isoform X2 [Erigeron canadensis]
MRSLLYPLARTQLVDLLSKLGCQYPFIAEEIKGVASADPANRKLFVRGLAWNTTTENLCAAFLEHGEIEEGVVIVDRTSGKSRGYGFITYKDIDSTRRALEAPIKLIDGRMAVCTLACEGVSSTTGTDLAQRKLFIGGLSPEITSEMLLGFFKKHGDIEEGSVAYVKDINKSRGFGFITYKTVEAAKNAIDDPQKMFGGRNITVKHADTLENKVVPAPRGIIPIPVHIAGYPKPHLNVGYAYPGAINQQSPSPSPLPYSIQSQISYTQRKDTMEPSAALPPRLATYPYYYTKIWACGK